MSAEGDPLQRRMDIRTEGQSRLMAVGGDMNGPVSFGDRIETQRQILISAVSPKLTPRKPNLWVDRTKVQADLLLRINDPQVRLIEVVALGGFGKSSLATWVAESVQAKGTQVIPSNFSKVPAFGLFGRWVLQELGFLTRDEIPDDELIDQLVYRLKQKPCLVVMDQLEAIAQAEDRDTFEKFLSEWQQYGQNSTVLVTTRQRFLSQEDIYLPLLGFTRPEGAAFYRSWALRRLCRMGC